MLEKFNLCSKDNVSTYAIAVGLLVYATIYLYLLFSSGDLVVLFNKFLVYIIGIDLLLSAFYTFNGNYNTENLQTPIIDQIDTETETETETELHTDTDTYTENEEELEEQELGEQIEQELGEQIEQELGEQIVQEQGIEQQPIEEQEQVQEQGIEHFEPQQLPREQIEQEHFDLNVDNVEQVKRRRGRPSKVQQQLL